MSTLKDLRISRNLTQRQAAEKTGISLRSYIAYENDPTKENTIKYRFLLQEIENVNVLDEEHGIFISQRLITWSFHTMSKSIWEP